MEKIIEDMINNPKKWFDWWDQFPLPEYILRELLYKTKGHKWAPGTERAMDEMFPEK